MKKTLLLQLSICILLVAILTITQEASADYSSYELQVHAHCLKEPRYDFATLSLMVTYKGKKVKIDKKDVQIFHGQIPVYCHPLEIRNPGGGTSADGFRQFFWLDPEQDDLCPGEYQFFVEVRIPELNAWGTTSCSFTIEE